MSEVDVRINSFCRLHNMAKGDAQKRGLSDYRKDYDENQIKRFLRAGR